MRLPFSQRHVSFGAVLVHQHNGLYDYHALARYAGEHVKQQLGLPVVLLEGTSTNVENTRKYLGEEKAVPFLNNRQLETLLRSPFEHTLFIDADFIVRTQKLFEVFEHHLDKRRAFSLMHTRNIASDSATLDRINPFRLWSTCFVFSGTSFLHRALKLLPYAKVNGNVLRNDYAVAMAALLTGNSIDEVAFPASYVCTFDSTEEEFSASTFDSHCMNKQVLFKRIYD